MQGTWSVKGSTITFVQDDGVRGTGQIEDGVMTNPLGKFVKQQP